MFLLTACARMGSPDGGWYDDTPPVVVSASPKDKGVNVKSKKATIIFDEVIKLEDAQSKVIVSPPQIEQAEIRATGKRIIIELKDTLKENTTYTVDFSDAISDNNEGNPMGNYTYSFSTGPQIDTLEVSGYCLNAEDLEPIKGILVGLYSTDSLECRADSTGLAADAGTAADGKAAVNSPLFHTTPFMRVSRTNGSGYFTIKGVAPGKYNVYALTNDDGDFVYNQKSETIGFSHEVVVPSSKPDVRQDTVWTDSLHIADILCVPYTHFLPDDVTLLCFQELQNDRHLLKTERKEPELLSLFFTYGSDTLPVLRGLNFDERDAFVIEASEHKDTINYWLRDTLLVNQDTLQIELSYMDTDTAGVLQLRTDTIEAIPKVGYEKRQKLKEKELEKWQKEQEKKKKREEDYDSIPPLEKLKLKIAPTGQITPVNVIRFEAPTPLAQCDTAGIHLYSKIDTLWYNASYDFRQVSARTYELRAEWREDVEYSLEVDSASMVSIYGLVNDPVKQGIKVQKAEDFSTVTVSVSGVSDTTTVYVELLDGSGKLLHSALLEKDRSATFFYLKAGSYYLRAFEDWNHNGRWDTGCYDLDLQAEPVYYHNEVVECKEKWDVTRQWNLTATPRYMQKPAKITKQKPEKAKQLKNRNLERAKEKGLKYLEGKGIRL